MRWGFGTTGILGLTIVRLGPLSMLLLHLTKTEKKGNIFAPSQHKLNDWRGFYSKLCLSLFLRLSLGHRVRPFPFSFFFLPHHHSLHLFKPLSSSPPSSSLCLYPFSITFLSFNESRAISCSYIITIRGLLCHALRYGGKCLTSYCWMCWSEKNKKSS